MHFNSTPILRASFALYDFLFGSHSTIWLHQHLKMIFEDVRLAREFHWGNVNRHSQHIWLLKNKATDKLHTRENKHTPDLKEEEQFDFDQSQAFSRFLQTDETQSRVLQNQACKEAALQNTPLSAGARVHPGSVFSASSAILSRVRDDPWVFRASYPNGEHCFH